jgi:hypothetical protein
MTHTLAQTEEMMRALRALPAMDSSKRRLTKQAVVTLLARELASLQARGYTMEQIAECLRGMGFEISTPTLKSYLQRVKQQNGKDAPKRRGRHLSRATPPTREREVAPPAATEPKADGAAKRTGKDAFLVKDKDSY